MTKFKTLIGAVAIASAMALVGCANPTGGNTDTEKTKPNQNDNASKLVKPEGVTINPNSKAIESFDEAIQMIPIFIGSTSVIDSEIWNSIKDTEEYTNTQKDALEAYDKIEKKNQEIINKAVQDGEPYDVTNTMTYNPHLYNLPNNNGSYEIISRVEQIRQGRIKNEKGGFIPISESPSNEYNTISKVLDVSKVAISEDNKEYVNGIISYINEHSCKNVPIENTKGTQSIENYNFSVMFDKNNFAGIFTMQGKIDMVAKTYSDAHIRFYDINGTLKYSFSDEEIDAFFSKVMNPQNQ